LLTELINNITYKQKVKQRA